MQRVIPTLQWDLRWNYCWKNWDHLAIRVACGVSPQSLMVETTTTSHNNLWYLTWNKFRYFHQGRALHKKKCSSSGNKRKEELWPYFRLTSSTISHKFPHSLNFCLREMIWPTTRWKCRKFSKITLFGQFWRDIDYSWLLIAPTAYYERRVNYYYLQYSYPHYKETHCGLCFLTRNWSAQTTTTNRKILI